MVTPGPPHPTPSLPISVLQAVRPRTRVVIASWSVLHVSRGPHPSCGAYHPRGPCSRVLHTGPHGVRASVR